MTTRIQDTFSDLKSQGHMAFMPFITAGDPDMTATAALLQELGKRKVDLIEVGFPYSDPIADGPVIQASYTRALTNGLRVQDIFDTVGSLPTDELPPLVAMVSYALIFRPGPIRFIEQAQEAGFSGFIVPDLPADEADELATLTQSHGLDLIQLIAPTTTPARAQRILESVSGFLYCISIAGTTGVRDELPTELNDQLKWLRSQSDIPLAVGFGISRPDQVESLRGVADGIIIGSAIVRLMESVSSGATDCDSAIADIGEFAAEMVAATHK
jgi:tryptophan synthase alpha chain